MVAGGLDRKNAGLDAARKIRSSEIRMIGSRIAALTTRVIMMSIECVQLNNRRPRTPSWAKNHHVDTVYSVAAETMVAAMRTLLRRMVNFCIGRRTCRPEEERVGLRLRLPSPHTPGRATWQPHFGHSLGFRATVCVSRALSLCRAAPLSTLVSTLLSDGALELSRHVMRIRVARPATYHFYSPGHRRRVQTMHV